MALSLFETADLLARVAPVNYVWCNDMYALCQITHAATCTGTEAYAEQRRCAVLLRQAAAHLPPAGLERHP